jgi:hypothetical protein
VATDICVLDGTPDAILRHVASWGDRFPLRSSKSSATYMSTTWDAGSPSCDWDLPSVLFQIWLWARGQDVRMSLHQLEREHEACAHLFRVATKDDGSRLPGVSRRLLSFNVIGTRRPRGWRRINRPDLSAYVVLRARWLSFDQGHLLI